MRPTTRIPLSIAVAALLTTAAACGGDDSGATADGSSKPTTTGATGGDLATAEVTIEPGAWVDAERDGGDELTGVTFDAPARAVCTTGVRVGVIPSTVDTTRVEEWTNATEEPVVYLDVEDVEGDLGDIGPCSVGYEDDEMADTLLHGQHTHEGHS